MSRNRIEVICDRDDLVAIADAVRRKTNKTEDMTLSEIVTNIDNISGGGTAENLDDVLNAQAEIITQLESAINGKAIGGDVVDTGDANATASDILSGKTAYAKGQKITGNIAFAPARTITPSTVSQVAISSKYYANGIITVAGDMNLVPDNIKKGTSIFGVTGNYEGNTAIGDATAVEMANRFIATRDFTVYDDPDIATIGGGVFAYCSNLSSVNFPNATNIGSYAFVSCSKLSYASFPAVKTIRDYAFSRCTSLKSFSAPNCNTISQCAFYYCFDLSSIYFPNCTTIGYQTFGGCSNLSSVTLPACNLVSAYAFAWCPKLSFIDLPECRTISGYGTFQACSNLKTINIPKCAAIHSSAFSGCSALREITLGKNIDTELNLYPSAFYNCKSLMSIFILDSRIAKLSNINVFSSTPMSLSTLTGSFGSIYVPAFLVSAYKSATNWATYANRITALKQITLNQNSFSKNIYYNQNIELSNCILCSGYDTIPTMTVLQENNLLTNISLTFNNNGYGTITATSTGITGTEILNISYIDPGTNKQKTLSLELEIYSVEQMTYSVKRAAGSNNSYNFIKNNDGFYESNNKGDAANNTYVLCQVSVTNNSSTSRELTVEYINFAESTCDYGVFYILDLATAPTGTSPGGNIHKTCRGESASGIKTLTYTIPSGTHTFYVKYLKDNSVSQNKDSLQFRLVDCQEVTA